MHLKYVPYFSFFLIAFFCAITGFGHTSIDTVTSSINITESKSEILRFSILDNYADLAVIEGENGELRRFHKLTFTWDGPDLLEEDATFRDYRLDVTFTSPSGKKFVVPGYFAADGNAGETSAIAGTKWRCHFNALEIGEYVYEASFRNGPNIAVDFDTTSGFPVAPMDGDTGSFIVDETNKTADDFRSKGKLEYVGEHFMQWTNGEYFMKIASNSPETFLEFTDFDNTSSTRSYSAHVGDWNTGDPKWMEDKGKGIIGAVNYLNEVGINGQYFVLHREGEAASPWVNPANSYYNYDVSKMDQWQIVFDHMMEKGLMAHFVFSESTNQSFFEVNVSSGDEMFSDARKLFFREIVARFGYLNAVTWNIGEENGWDRRNLSWTGEEAKALTTEQQLAFTTYIDELAYYNDFITVHNGPASTINSENTIYDNLQGDNSITGTSMQSFHGDPFVVEHITKKYRNESARSGKKWVAYLDEAWQAGPTVTSLFRSNLLWPNLVGGGAGIEYYATDGLDLTLEDFSFYSEFYEQMRHAYDFYHENDIPFYNMYNQDDLVTNGWCHGDDFKNIVIYVKSQQVGTTTIDLLGDYEVQWYDPREGGDLQSGTVVDVSAGEDIYLGEPPSNTDQDWVILIRNNSTGQIAVEDVLVSPAPLEIGQGSTFKLNAQVLPGNADEKGIIWSSDDASIATVDSDGNVFGAIVGSTIIRATTVDGGFVGQSTVNVIDSSNFCLASGTLLMERYDGIPGVFIDDLLNATVFPDNPSMATELDVFEIPTNTGDEYGVRLSGYLCAPESGAYTFWISGDDHVQLNLSTDNEEANAAMIAFHTNYSGQREWNKSNNQRSLEIQLQQGQQYYIEALMKEASGGDHLAVGWRKPSDGPGAIPTEVIPGNFMSPGEYERTGVTGIVLNVSNADIGLGETLELIETIAPEDASDVSVVWSSDDSSLVSVDESGNIVGLAVGTTSIRATTVDGDFVAVATITVIDESIINVTGITVTPDETNLVINGTLVLEASLEPSNATNQEIIWSSDDSSLVSVDENGNIVGLAVGTTSIIATTVNGDFVAVATITVIGESIINVTGITVTPDETNLVINGTLVLEASLEPSNATNQEIIWSSDDSSLVSVDESGNIVGLAVGTTSIIATTVDGDFVAEAIITVIDESIVSVSGITVTPDATNLVIGGTLVLEASIEPLDASNQNVVWSSADVSIVSVDANGELIGVSLGTSVISVTTVDGNFVAQSTVTVVENGQVNVTGIDLAIESTTLEIGETQILEAIITPTNATNTALIWSSEDASIVSVDANGEILGVAIGLTVISVTTEDGNLVAEAIVTVVDNDAVRVTNITVSPSSVELELDSTLTLIASIEPNDASNQEVVWSSADPSTVSVDVNGELAGLSLGTTVIIVTTVDGSFVAQSTVTVVETAQENVTGIDIAIESTTLEVGETQVLQATITPADAINVTVLWSSEDSSIVTVNDDGEIFGVAIGTTVIGATTEDGNFVAQATVNVVESEENIGRVAVTGINVNIDDLVLFERDIVQIIGTVLPENASNDFILWVPEDLSIVGVDENGNVIAYKVGETSITATTFDGGFSKTITITVLPNKSVVYPNPTSDMINITGIDERVGVFIHDSSGVLVKKEVGGRPIYVGDLSDGNYLIVLSIGDRIRFIKI